MLGGSFGLGRLSQLKESATALVKNAQEQARSCVVVSVRERGPHARPT